MKKIALFSFFIFSINLCFSQIDSIAKIKYSKFSKGDIIISPDLSPNADSVNTSATPYDDRIVGVFTQIPEKMEYDKRMVNIRINPVINKGITEVKYNSENGMIKKGDPITTSSQLGVGMKAVKSGMIIGIALEDAKKETGLIKIRISVQFIYK